MLRKSFKTALTPTLTFTLIVATLSACTPTRFDPIASTTQVKTEIPIDVVVPTPVPQPKVLESFTQDESANKVDVLVINDNSYSMEVEQTKMAEKFPSFISAFEGLDYQITMTTTDIGSADAKLNLSGRVVNWSGTPSKFLTSKTSSANSVFKNTIRREETIGCVKRGDCPSGDEQPLRAAMLAMDQRLTTNAGVFRDNTDLAIIVLSDEDELSDGGPMATKPKEVIERFRAHFGNSKGLAVYGIVIQPGDEACRKNQLKQTKGGNGAYFGTHVTELAALTGGSTVSICEADYSKSLADISSSVRRLVGTFELNQTPVAGSVEVVLTPAQKIPFKVVGKKVIFDTPPPAGTRVEISYNY
ncbi:MAG: hypothetical protein EOP05_01800 [Proteobacteria bacterium]|nr:MAG: hypothetical protein EOP05_01800 [Pseudomonadota bacterium]